MAKLINGNGNKAIWPAQDADLIASICGNVTGIAAVGSKFSYTQEDANTIGVADGVIITKEGRRIQLDSGSMDLFTIPTGQLGVTSYYIIGYKLVQNSDTTQTCETFVQKMNNATDVITEDTFRGGATEVYVSLYRVTQVGMNIDTVDLLLPELSNINEAAGSGVSISVTADGVKKYSDLISELVTLSSGYTLNGKSVLYVDGIAFSKSLHSSNNAFTAIEWAGSNAVTVRSVRFSATPNYGSTVITSGSVVSTALQYNVPTNGSVLTLYI